MFGRATITLGIGPHSSLYYFSLLTVPFLFPFSLLFFLLTFAYLLPSRIWTRSISRPEVVGGDRTWV